MFFTFFNKDANIDEKTIHNLLMEEIMTQKENTEIWMNMYREEVERNIEDKQNSYKLNENRDKRSYDIIQTILQINEENTKEIIRLNKKVERLESIIREYEEDESDYSSNEDTDNEDGYVSDDESDNKPISSLD